MSFRMQDPIKFFGVSFSHTIEFIFQGHNSFFGISYKYIRIEQNNYSNMNFAPINN